MPIFERKNLVLNDVIKRRVEFLLMTSKHEDKKDQVVTYAMRVLSNYATIGKDASSAEIKKRNVYVSREASYLLGHGHIALYYKSTINEHPKPLNVMWEWLKEKNYILKVEDVWQEFLENPMVTITRQEDMLIKSSGQNAKGNLQSRYSDLGIEIIKLTKEPGEYSWAAKGTRPT